MLRLRPFIRIGTRLLNSNTKKYPTLVLHRVIQGRRMATAHSSQLNRLGTAKSPYLRQHATNPVDWYPFEKAALDKAKAENKVITLELWD